MTPRLYWSLAGPTLPVSPLTCSGDMRAGAGLEMRDLQRDLPLRLRVQGEVHRARRSAAQLLEDAVVGLLGRGLLRGRRAHRGDARVRRRVGAELGKAALEQLHLAREA